MAEACEPSLTCRVCGHTFQMNFQGLLKDGVCSVCRSKINQHEASDNALTTEQLFGETNKKRLTFKPFKV